MLSDLINEDILTIPLVRNNKRTSVNDTPLLNKLVPTDKLVEPRDSRPLISKLPLLNGGSGFKPQRRFISKALFPLLSSLDSSIIVD
jgi:hypothetical protein